MSDSPSPWSQTEAYFTFQVDNGSSSDLRVVAFEGVEGISQPYHYTLRLYSQLPEVDIETILGKPCLLEIFGAGSSRCVHGIVSRFVTTGGDARGSHFLAEFVSPMWVLTQRIRSRIFFGGDAGSDTIITIIKKVIADAGLSSMSIDDRTTGTYMKREYTVQYCESEWDFINRLAEEEGLYYFFQHDDQGVKFVLADAPSAHKPAAVPKYDFRSDGTTVSGPELHEIIVSKQEARRLVIKDVLQRDHNFEQSRPFIEGEATNPQGTFGGKSYVTGTAGTKLYEYPGGFRVEADGKRLAKIRADEARRDAYLFELRGSVRTLGPGEKFGLQDGGQTAIVEDLIPVTIRHRGTQYQSVESASGSDEPIFETVIEAFPGTMQYRPPRVTPRPFVQGTQTATVVGPSGEEIYVDKYGRVKVQFHWDIDGKFDENSSLWVRVAHGMAGGQYGILFLPRVGQEVVVDFLEGNPDRPIVMGSVYNSQQMPAYTLPDEKTKSYIKTHSSKGGGGTNEIRFEDKKGSEQLGFFAERDLHIRVKHDSIETVVNEKHVTVEKNVIELIKEKKNVEVKLDLLQKVGGNVLLEIAGDCGEVTKGKQSLETGGDYYIKSKAKLIIEATSGITLKVGGNFIVIDSAGVSIKGTKIALNSGGSAGSGSPVSTEAPGEPNPADEVQPGQDVTYSAAARQFTPVSYTPIANVREEDETEPPPTSWVEIEMVDEDGEPWPDEEYEVKRADGKIIKGRLDSKGRAHVFLPKKEGATLRFPDLDGRAWEKL
ncbi:MAG: type VI secretion system tip protein TssI/VgrG [Phycisphaerae bacterium]